MTGERSTLKCKSEAGNEAAALEKMNSIFPTPRASGIGTLVVLKISLIGYTRSSRADLGINQLPK